MTTTLPDTGRSTIRYLGVFRPGLEKDMTELIHTAQEHTLRYWRKEYAWRHFNMGAHSRYGGKFPYVYEKRRGPMKWMVRRFNVPDEVIPLVSKGNLRNAFLGGSMKLTRSGQGGKSQVKATWPGLPRYTYMFDPTFEPDFAQNYRNRSRRGGNVGDQKMHPLRHAKYLELTIVNEEEAADLREYFGRRLDRLLAAQN